MGKYFNKNTVFKIVELFVLLKRDRQSDSSKYEVLLLDSYLEYYFTQIVKYELIEYYLKKIDDLPLQFNANNQVWLNEVRKEIIHLSTQIDQAQKYQLAFTCFEFLQATTDGEYNGDGNALADEIYQTIVSGFHLDEVVCNDVKTILNNNFALVNRSENLIVVGRFKHHRPKSYITIDVEEPDGKLWFYYVEQIDCYVVKYIGSLEVRLNSQILNTDCIYQLNKGGIVSYNSNIVVSYSQLKSKLYNQREISIELAAKDLSFSFKNSGQGVKPLSINIKGGELLAIMGGSGTGKTTLLSLLSGRIKPNHGEILINGINLLDPQKNDELFKQIGFVPQMDLLNEDLTVHQNLYYSAQLSRDNLSKNEKDEKIVKLLSELGLSNAKNLKVGTAVDKVISGGQRKRLNIALELIREPSILFVDEPSSGLSSKDALQVISMLRQIANMGKIVVINIHQPTSEIFHLFDKLVILDKDGYPVYFGEPFYAASYFKKHLGLVDSAIDDSVQIGYYNPEQIMDLIEYQKLGEDGDPINERVIQPVEWHQLLINNKSIGESNHIALSLPDVGTKVPPYLKQILIYFKRNVISRFADQSYGAFTLLGAPVLALIISFLLRTSGYQDGPYKLINNVNMPVLIFIGVVVSLFFGMINSVGEIHKDKRQLKQESYLNLSTSAYLISKIAYILIINLYQIGVYVLISTSIIEIKGLFWHYLLVLWMASGVMSMIGLYVSIKLNSILSTYIAIPFILIPQILLAGAILDFDDVHGSIANKKYVPFFGDLMVSRWTYEAIVDIQMSENLYSRNYHDLYVKKSSVDYCLNFLIPKLKVLIEKKDAKDIEYDSYVAIKSGFDELANYYHSLPVSNLNVSAMSDKELYDLLDRIIIWLKEIKSVIRDEIVERSEEEQLESGHFENDKLEELVLKRNRYINYIINDNEIIRKFEPAYYSSANRFGRAHLYAPYKKILRLDIKTWQFNIVVLILMELIIALMVLLSLKKKYNK